MVDVIGAELEQTLERANLMNAKQYQFKMHFKKQRMNIINFFFGGVMKKDSVMDWAKVILRLEELSFTSLLISKNCDQNEKQ